MVVGVVLGQPGPRVEGGTLGVGVVTLYMLWRQGCHVVKGEGLRGGGEGDPTHPEGVLRDEDELVGALVEPAPEEVVRRVGRHRRQGGGDGGAGGGGGGGRVHPGADHEGRQQVEVGQQGAPPEEPQALGEGRGSLPTGLQALYPTGLFNLRA